MWIYDTGEHQAMHIEGIKKATVLDAFVYPFVALCKIASEGKICNQVSGKHVDYTEITTRKQHKKTA